MEKHEITLPEEVAKSYKPAPGAVREMAFADLGRVNLNTINLALAEKLAEKGVLVKVEGKK
jgi:hypothetical protein